MLGTTHCLFLKCRCWVSMLRGHWCWVHCQDPGLQGLQDCISWKMATFDLDLNNSDLYSIAKSTGADNCSTINIYVLSSNTQYYHHIISSCYYLKWVWSTTESPYYLPHLVQGLVLNNMVHGSDLWSVKVMLFNQLLDKMRGELL